MSHPVFEAMNAPQLKEANFDAELKNSESELTGVFFWGHDCPNCDIAKKILLQDLEILNEFKIKWFHVNTYEDFDLGVRFGLHGIPTFLFFYQGKRLGKISPFPGSEPFFDALKELRKKYPANYCCTPLVSKFGDELK